DHLRLSGHRDRAGMPRPGSLADREHLRAWLARFADREDVAFAVEGCAGWRYVAEELAAAGITAHLAEPADTVFARGRKRHAKTDKTDARHLRMLLAEGRLPECWIPPARILECRALLELYNDLRRERTAWAQRIHAVLFHQGAPQLGEGALRTEKGVAGLRAAAAGCLSPAGLHVVRHQLTGAARHLAGAKAPADRLYGAGPVTALAITCRPGGAGRFSCSRQAVRFAGPGHHRGLLRPQGARPGSCPGRDRRCSAGPPARQPRPTPAPRPPTTATTPRSRTARTASAPACPGAGKILRQARHILA